MARARFLNGYETHEICVTRTQVYYMVDFDIPDEIKDIIPAEAIGIRCMDFYADPHIGCSVSHVGHQWRITDIDFPIVPYRSHKTKLLPTIKTEYIGLCPLSP